MNDTVIHELEVLVERCVRPVRAPFASKKRMREDLFSHLSSTFEDEFAKSNDESKALGRTRERFGDSAEVSRELQQSVSVSERIACFVEQVLAMQPGESFLHLAGKHFLVCFCLAALTTLLVMPLELNKSHPDPLTCVWVFSVVLTVMSFTGTLMQWLIDQAGRAMHSSDDCVRRRRRKWGYSLLSLLMFPGAMLSIHLGLGLYLGMSAMLPSPSMTLVVLLLAPFGPAITFLMAPPAGERILYQEKWATLDMN